MLLLTLFLSLSCDVIMGEILLVQASPFHHHQSQNYHFALWLLGEGSGPTKSKESRFWSPPAPNPLVYRPSCQPPPSLPYRYGVMFFSVPCVKFLVLCRMKRIYSNSNSSHCTSWWFNSKRLPRCRWLHRLYLLGQPECRT